MLIFLPSTNNLSSSHDCDPCGQLIKGLIFHLDFHTCVFVSHFIIESYSIQSLPFHFLNFQITIFLFELVETPDNSRPNL